MRILKMRLRAGLEVSTTNNRDETGAKQKALMAAMKYTVDKPFN